MFNVIGEVIDTIIDDYIVFNDLGFFKVFYPNKKITLKRRSSTVCLGQ